MKHTELRVKQGVTTITRVFVYLIAAGVFSVCALLLPEIAREEARSNPHAGPVLPYFLGAWILSIPVFIALYETHKLLGYIDENKAFSALSIQALQRIKKYCWENGIELGKYIDWGNNYYLYHDRENNRIYNSRVVHHDYSVMRFYFKTQEDCKKVIDNCSEDIKIYFINSLV